MELEVPERYSTVFMIDLSNPVAQIARRVETIDIESSLGTASLALQRAKGSLIAVCENETYIGAFTEAQLFEALKLGIGLDSGIRDWVTQIPTIAPHQSGSEVLRILESVSPGTPVIAITEQGKIWGIVFPSDLFPKPTVLRMPSSIGGMATPFGVYLLGGGSWAGPRPWGLLASGAILVSIIFFGRIVGTGFTTLLIHAHLSMSIIALSEVLIPISIFAFLMRAIPLSGIHAAEHMTVHALERGEPLTVEAVRRMPRVHPRCGTNIATAAMIVIGLGTADLGHSADLQSVQFALASLVAWTSWRKIGSYVQYYVTTKPPTDKQIQMGIDSAKKLIEKYSRGESKHFGFLRMIFESGILFTALGGWLTGALISVILNATGHLDWLGI